MILTLFDTYDMIPGTEYFIQRNLGALAVEHHTITEAQRPHRKSWHEFIVDLYTEACEDFLCHSLYDTTILLTR